MMKSLLIIITITISPLILRAQYLTLGTPRDSVRKAAQSLTPVAKSTQSDTCDAVQLTNNWQFVFYYQGGKLHRMKIIYPVTYAEVMRNAMNQKAKSVNDHLWIDEKAGTKYQLTVERGNNRYVLDMTPIDKKD